MKAEGSKISIFWVQKLVSDSLTSASKTSIQFTVTARFFLTLSVDFPVLRLHQFVEDMLWHWTGCKALRCSNVIVTDQEKR